MPENNKQINAVKAMREVCESKVRIRRALLALMGDTARTMAEKLDVDPSYISLTIHGLRKNRELQKAISDMWQVPVEEIF